MRRSVTTRTQTRLSSVPRDSHPPWQTDGSVVAADERAHHRPPASPPSPWPSSSTRSTPARRPQRVPPPFREPLAVGVGGAGHRFAARCGRITFPAKGFRHSVARPGPMGGCDRHGVGGVVVRRIAQTVLACHRSARRLARGRRSADLRSRTPDARMGRSALSMSTMVDRPGRGVASSRPSHGGVHSPITNMLPPTVLAFRRRIDGSIPNFT